MESHSWMISLSIVVLLMGSVFFSAAETAIATFNKVRIKKKAEEGDARAEKLLRIAENYDKAIFTVLIGKNIANIKAVTLAAVLMIRAFGFYTGAVVTIVGMGLLVLFFGELLPKSLGKSNSDRFMLVFCVPLSLFIWLFTPLSLLFAAINKAVTRGGVKGQPSITEEELIYMMDSIEEEGVLEEQERDLVQSALEFDEIAIREILTPRVNITALDVEFAIDKMRQIVLEEGFSRIPVYENGIDNIIGVLYSRDFLCALIKGVDVDIRKMIAEPLFVHEGMKLSQLLAHFKAHKVNLAVVVDEYGGTAGIVTMEDVLEELVGDIWDEDDEIPHSFVQMDENTYEVFGEHNLWDMFERLDIDPKAVESDYSTASGWALHMLEHIPKIGEEFTYMNFRFTVLEMDGQRLQRMRISATPQSERDKEQSLAEK